MSIFIEKDKESDKYVDYFFVCDAWEPDPRYKSRFMCTGQRRGLFRIRKSDQAVELLFPMEYDGDAKRFERAAGKVLALYKRQGAFPQKAHYASG